MTATLYERILSLTWYLARFSPPPDNIVKDLGKLQNAFVWRNQVPNPGDRKGAGWIAASAAQLPTSQGGLSLCNIPAQMKAIRAKWVVDLLVRPGSHWATTPKHWILEVGNPIGLGMRILLSKNKKIQRLLLVHLKQVSTNWHQILKVLHLG